MKRLLTTIVIVAILIYCAYSLILQFFPMEYRDTIAEECRKHNLDPAWVSAVICAESGFVPDANSPKGAVGLMQVMPQTGEWIAEQMGLESFDLYQPEDNIAIGCTYLAMLLEQYDSKFLALCAYNAGEGRVDKWLAKSSTPEQFRSLLYEETSKYCIKIENYEKVYRTLYWRREK